MEPQNRVPHPWLALGHGWVRHKLYQGGITINPNYMTILEQGFSLAPNVLPTETLATFIKSTIDLVEGRSGVRNLLDIPAFRKLATSAQFAPLSGYRGVAWGFSPGPFVRGCN